MYRNRGQVSGEQDVLRNRERGSRPDRTRDGAQATVEVLLRNSTGIREEQAWSRTG